jgi:hypothetical protein
MKLRQGMPILLAARGLVCAWSLAALAAASQWIPEGPPNVLGDQFMTTGGITYLRLTGLLPGGSCCRRIAAYEVSGQDSHLTQIVQQEAWGGGCIAIYCPPWPQEVVSVLGALPPGSYDLTLLAEGAEFPPFPPELPSPWSVLSFTVPTNSSPTLSVSKPATTNSPALLIHVAGVSNVMYVLESSADLTHWTPLRTNYGAPVTFSAPVSEAPNRFYRTSVWPVSSGY